MALNVGVNDVPATVKLAMVGLSDKATSRYSPVTHSDALHLRSNFVTLDWLAEHLKLVYANALVIDAEGSELDVIIGAKKLIAMSPELVILVEIHPNLRRGIVSDVITTLSTMGFNGILASESHETVTFVFKRRS